MSRAAGLSRTDRCTDEECIAWQSVFPPVRVRMWAVEHAENKCSPPGAAACQVGGRLTG